MSKFKSDLNKEQILAEYLDDIYTELGLDVKRVSDSTNQNKGIDLIIEHNTKKYFVDEKAQLHYLNTSLPTFAFELSYLKGGVLKQGWLFDKKKQTDYYFLVTSIFLKENKSTLKFKTDIKSIKIISVNRIKLINVLCQIGVDLENLECLIYTIRETEAFGKHAINGMDNRSEGNIHFTENLSEQPINLVLKLEYLIESDVAKVIYRKR